MKNQNQTANFTTIHNEPLTEIEFIFLCESLSAEQRAAFLDEVQRGH
jgi:hypothetical protein